MSNIEISSTLFVSPKTVSRIYRLFVNTGNLASTKVFGRPKGTTTLYDHEELVIYEMLLLQPTIHLNEIVYEIEKTTYTRGCIKKCPEYKIASKLVYLQNYGYQQQPTANIGLQVCISVNFVFICSVAKPARKFGHAMQIFLCL